jgi:hypothetical protein
MLLRATLRGRDADPLARIALTSPLRIAGVSGRDVAQMVEHFPIHRSGRLPPLTQLQTSCPRAGRTLYRVMNYLRFLALLSGCECCLLARRVVRHRGQYLVPALFGEHIAGAGTDALGVVGVEIEGAYRAVSAGGV